MMYDYLHVLAHRQNPPWTAHASAGSSEPITSVAAWPTANTVRQGRSKVGLSECALVMVARKSSSAKP
jgi:hypothetical protein